ncbi:MAG: iron-containing alcohol dehydrogenase, partial [Firmicutes bacterium]|nr:iron-containing alcohol dehydrogenase [Bacillota bacterium]
SSHEGEHLTADQQAIDLAQGAIARAKASVVVVVGSGTLTDIGRYASAQSGIPFVSVATAPSVDGYASTVAALQFDGMKVTKAAQAPVGIFALPSVLSEAPWELIQAGFGDLIGKTTSLLDWKLACQLYSEDWCQASYDLVASSLNECLTLVDRLLVRDPQAVEALFNGLLSSGIAMAMMGNSRPASGSEHHCSHYWDFLAYKKQRRHGSHGMQVGFATYFTMQAYEALALNRGVREPEFPEPDAAWFDEVRNRWGVAADEVIAQQSAKRAWIRQQEKPVAWGDHFHEAIVDALKTELSGLTDIRRALALMGLSTSGASLEVTSDVLYDTLLHAREVRARFTIFDFWAGQGLLEEIARVICAKALL